MLTQLSWVRSVASHRLKTTCAALKLLRVLETFSLCRMLIGHTVPNPPFLLLPGDTEVLWWGARPRIYQGSAGPVSDAVQLEPV
jgi:hypothetical protein